MATIKDTIYSFLYSNRDEKVPGIKNPVKLTWIFSETRELEWNSTRDLSSKKKDQVGRIQV